MIMTISYTFNVMSISLHLCGGHRRRLDADLRRQDGVRLRVPRQRSVFTTSTTAIIILMLYYYYFLITITVLLSLLLLLLLLLL